ncbi:LysR family transcriptional regulator [Solimonas marina]|uniref:LysR family transcriptional regulator n=1 Tax=Solimonas marina TaxID=2714601 RepID=A0A970B5P2_9GAMM|nr:LysR family transcriptional regulator [Solimonas marina]NKF21923.1 LysR family transcriptional regulator [Solimonas marina]
MDRVNALHDLDALRVFERVASLGSLTAAAEDMGLSLAVVSKRLARLESGLGLRLLQRSTRRLSITEEGRLLREHTLRVLADLEQAEAALARQQGHIAGTLRLTAPNSFGRRYVVPLLAGFTALHPHLQLQLQLSDDVLDLVADNFDLAIRYGMPPDSSYVAVPLAPNHRVLCASPDYIARRGAPTRLAELAAHDCIVLGPSPAAEWRFGSGQKQRSVRVRGRYCANDGEATHAMALAGMGIALKSIWDVYDDLQAGRLRQILPRHAELAVPLNAVYWSGRHVAPRVGAFIAYVRDKLVIPTRVG